jgi:hypothetical protein
MAAERLYDWLVDEHRAIPESLRIKMKFADRTRIVDEPLYLSEDGEVRIAR